MQTKKEINEIFEKYFITKITMLGTRARVRKEILEKRNTFRGRNIKRFYYNSFHPT